MNKVIHLFKENVKDNLIFTKIIEKISYLSTEKRNREEDFLI